MSESIDKATAAAEGLRAFADSIERHPELARTLDYSRLTVIADDADDFAYLVRALGGKRTKNPQSWYLHVTRSFGPLNVGIAGVRVCERVVVGTETVEIPDPNAPKVTVEQDIVEWKCPPVLDPEAA